MAYFAAIAFFLALSVPIKADGSLGELVYAPRHASADYYSYPRYAFEYAVRDPHTGDNKAQWEKRDGDVVIGAYSLVEPDGSLRVVEYRADDKTGFNAVVKRIGPNIHPIATPIYKASIPSLGYKSSLPQPIVRVAVLEKLANAPLYNSAYRGGAISGPLYKPIAPITIKEVVPITPLGKIIQSPVSAPVLRNNAEIIPAPINKGPITPALIYKGPIIPESIYKGPILTESIYKGPIIPESIYKGPIIPESIYKGPILPESIYKGPITPESIYKGPIIPESIYKGPILPESIYKGPIIPEPIYKGPIIPEPMYKGLIYPGPIYKGPIIPETIYKGPIIPQSIYKGPIIPEAIYKRPIIPIYKGPINPTYNVPIPQYPLYKPPIIQSPYRPTISPIPISKQAPLLRDPINYSNLGMSGSGLPGLNNSDPTANRGIDYNLLSKALIDYSRSISNKAPLEYKNIPQYNAPLIYKGYTG